VEVEGNAYKSLTLLNKPSPSPLFVFTRRLPRHYISFIYIMPFLITKQKDNTFRLKRNNGTYVKATYKTKQSAINAGLNFMRYHKEKGIVKGNRIIVKK
jgi:hypothetical protein